MKNQTKLLIAGIVITFSISCNKDDDPEAALYSYNDASKWWCKLLLPTWEQELKIYVQDGLPTPLQGPDFAIILCMHHEIFL